MKKTYLVIRSVILWAISWLHFMICVPLMLLVGWTFGQRRTNFLLRQLAKNVCFLAGVKVTSVYSPGFDPTRTSFLLSNHVNIFDPFVLYSVIPQFFRGLELESHFRVPFYGWLMRGFGNVPVADDRGAAQIKRTFRLTKEALQKDISLLVFPEGGRTLDGRVASVEDGAFVMARQFGYPIVPISITGSYEFKRKGDWLLRPSHIVVHFHDTIETEGMSKGDIQTLRDRVREIIKQPVDAHNDAMSRKD